MKQANLDLSVIERFMESDEPLTDEQREWVLVAVTRTKAKIQEFTGSELE